MKGFLLNLQSLYPTMKIKMEDENGVYNRMCVDLMQNGESFYSVFSRLNLEDFMPNDHYEPRVQISFMVFDFNRRTREVGRNFRIVGATMSFVTKEVVSFSGHSFGHDQFNDRFGLNFYTSLAALFENELLDNKNYFLHVMKLQYFKRRRSIS